MIEQRKINRLMIVIVPRGRGRQVQQVLLSNGATTTSCLFGRGFSASRWLRSLALDTQEKEIVLAFVPNQAVAEVFSELEKKQKISQPKNGLAFTLPLDASFSLLDAEPEKADLFFRALDDASPRSETEMPAYVLAMLITDKGKAEQALEVAQEHGFRGATIIRAYGTANGLIPFLDMLIEPEKDLLMILTPETRGEELLTTFVEALHLDAVNTGVTALIKVCEVVGLGELSSDGEVRR